MTNPSLPSDVALHASGRRAAPSAIAGVLAAALSAGLMIACAGAPSTGSAPRPSDPATGGARVLLPWNPADRQDATLVSWSGEGNDRPATLRSGRIWGPDPHCGDVSLLDSIPRVPLRIEPPWPRLALNDKGSHGAIFGAP